MPLLLSERDVSYDDQARFNSVFYPFSCKLVWAPLVDAVYSRRFGRRKSWLVPAQIAIGGKGSCTCEPATMVPAWYHGTEKHLYVTEHTWHLSLSTEIFI